MEILLPGILENAQNDKYLSPEEYTYWKARENRTFYIDYEIDDMYNLVELGKIIVQLKWKKKIFQKRI